MNGKRRDIETTETLCRSWIFEGRDSQLVKMKLQRQKKIKQVYRSKCSTLFENMNTYFSDHIFFNQIDQIVQ